ncbi:tyrosine-protein kinase Fer isoform 9-T15 [Alca torda]
MGFGGDLKYSHDALLKLQDWELRLLETVKKFMVMRVKSDKEYASTLQNLCNQVDKESTCQLDYISNVSKSWLLVVQQTEQLSKIMKTHAEDLNSGPLHRLTMMIKDKQQVKKSYVGVHQQIEAEMYKVTKTELEKLKSSYRQLIKEVNSAKEKYKEAVAKESPGTSPVLHDLSKMMDSSPAMTSTSSLSTLRCIPLRPMDLWISNCPN